jgi:hypothetical protein
MSVGDVAEGRSREIERFVPRDPLPSWVRIALGPRPLHRMEQPVRVIDELRAARPFEQIASPVGCRGSGWSATNRPFSTTAIAPHRETQSAQ